MIEKPDAALPADDSLDRRIDALLPQTQCGQCGHAGCMPYARAMAAGAADINQCPPGGGAVIEALANLLGRAVKPLDVTRGREKPRSLARIVESDCIGCTKCIQACPVDAIVGAGKQMHTVIDDHCTGCELCVPACPVDCIELLPMPAAQIDPPHADAARLHFQRRQTRLAYERSERQAELAARKAAMARPAEAAVVTPGSISRSAVMEAVARARAKRAARRQPGA